ncbi:hypothetical protein H0H81_011057 [Sphagnurus paluster]|uniref:Uncharacterized protein n=1 Tax=Sphagnurus paluster TaxID=117069 RepID=A0A9P7G0S9_9AGAR|nr:hypothetical protein H0H81_011057 [Sphagnurus paluster]
MPPSPLDLIADELKCVSLPLYTPSEPSPRYSCEPSVDERTLQQTPRISRSAPTGEYIKKSGKVIVTLFEQEHGVEIPTYGRRDEITGTVYLQAPERVTQVVLKIEGRLNTIISDGGSRSITVLSRSHTLWRKESSQGISNVIPFSYLLPSHFTHAGSERPLPPTYYVGSSGIPALHVRSDYTIAISVTRSRHHNLDFLTKVDHIKIPFLYHPRTRANRPIVPSPSFFSTVKTSPEEWYQVFTAMKTRVSSNIEPIYCHLFIPGARVFGLKDKIPIHIQMSGPLDSLQKLLMPQARNAPPPPAWSRETREKCPAHSKPKIKVSILRQTHVESRGRKGWKNTTIGDGEIWEVPPAICEAQGAVHLDWEGELIAHDTIAVGGFAAGNVVVKDFIVLTVDPPTVGNHPSTFLALQMSVPVRIVTDSYVEVTDYEPPAA